MTTTNRSLADRLADLIARIKPGATYQFEPSADGREILRITTDPVLGEAVAVAGATKADAIAAMEQRFPAKD